MSNQTDHASRPKAPPRAERIFPSKALKHPLSRASPVAQRYKPMTVGAAQMENRKETVGVACRRADNRTGPADRRWSERE